jgi:creatinine amidohydrolase/Fe(II)-dependent formamide hydrolase-like protein
MTSLFLSELSSPTIEVLLRQGFDTVLVNLASTEQHGPALPLCVDVAHGRETCRRAAIEVGHCLIGADVPFGCASQHASFAGSISVRRETLIALLEDLAESYARAGFRLVYFWIAHAENDPVLREALPRLRSRFAGTVVTGVSSLSGYLESTWGLMGRAEGVSTAEAGSHAGEIETSMMLAIDPMLVEMGAAAEGNLLPFEQLAGRMMAEGMALVSPNGVLGDQRPAEAGRGHRYLDRLAGWLAEDLRRARREAGLA